jgi:aryl-alcohol dehydrogenase-like predicted oxidoreductase
MRSFGRSHRITTIAGTPASRLGLAAYPEQDPRCLRRALARGINYFFFYSPGHREFVDALGSLAKKRREDVIVATGSGSRKPSGLRSVRKKAFAAVGSDVIDVFFAEYVNPGDAPDAIFGNGGVLDELCEWKAEGSIRYVGATAHDRQIARALAADPRVDVLMHRYNMAHRKAAVEVFPTALEAKTPVIAFTATRWGTLLEPHEGWQGDLPTAADCYRFCLAQPAVQIVLTAPKSIQELTANLAALDSHAMTRRECAKWGKYGVLVYGGGSDRFETEWP